MISAPARFFHLHLVSDSTGETSSTVARAVASRYPAARAIEHSYVMVRSAEEVQRIASAIEAAPGIVLYTIVDRDLAERLAEHCRTIGVPAISILDPVLSVFQSYLGDHAAQTIGAQHVLDADYFQRIEALNFALAHDDGALPEDLDSADIILVGVSRTSKTPTSIYLAHRGFRTANYPLVPGVAVPQRLKKPSKAFIVGLLATTDRIVQVRLNRVLSDHHRDSESDYTDKSKVAAEIAAARRLFANQGWPTIDVTRRSVEETAAAILTLYRDHNDATEIKPVSDIAHSEVAQRAPVR
ncbi:MAG: pyruvate, water dikinase regulatory protein [Pseudomonadota bacterium]